MSATIITSVVTGGTNNHATTVSEVNAIGSDFFSQGVVGAMTNTSGVAPATGGYAVNAQGTPNMTVAVSGGTAYITATPSGQSSQLLRAYSAAGDSAYTINANASGSTKYDWIYLQVNPTNANNPAADASDVTAIYTSRSSSNTTDNGSPPTYGIPLAIVTVANGASSIANSNISDSRYNTSGGGALLGNIRTYTASSTWTKPNGIKFAVVETVGGGGAGGGSVVGSGTQHSIGSGGAAGGYSRSRILAASLSSTETVTVGAAGVGASGTTGGSGGTSSFGSHVSANGGSGGTTQTTTATTAIKAGTTGAAAGTGDFATGGGSGGGGFLDTSNANAVMSGIGGASIYGGGGPPQAANAAGVSATVYGAGGSGSASSSNAGSATAGGNGGGGVVIVYEYY